MLKDDQEPKLIVYESAVSSAVTSPTNATQSNPYCSDCNGVGATEQCTGWSPIYPDSNLCKTCGHSWKSHR
jgi:hypothetical protein